MRWLPIVVLLVAGVASAHDADVVYVLAKQGPGRLVETVTLTGASLALLVPIDADGDALLTQADLDAKQKALRIGVWDEMPLSAGGRRCAVLETRAWLREGFVELEGTFDCGEGELRQDFRFLRVLPANYRVVLGSQLEGEAAGRGFAQGSMTSVTVPRPPPPGAWDGSQFRAGFDGGVRRGLSLLGGLMLLGVLLGAGT
ncbi:MAG: HupE/UreJ family protein, partial [Myxococcota bacterium]